jgi:hypothetical protein
MVLKAWPSTNHSALVSHKACEKRWSTGLTSNLLNQHESQQACLVMVVHADVGGSQQEQTYEAKNWVQCISSKDQSGHDEMGVMRESIRLIEQGRLVGSGSHRELGRKENTWWCEMKCGFALWYVLVFPLLYLILHLLPRCFLYKLSYI